MVTMDHRLNEYLTSLDRCIERREAAEQMFQEDIESQIDRFVDFIRNDPNVDDAVRIALNVCFPDVYGDHRISCEVKDFTAAWEAWREDTLQDWEDS